MVYHSIRLSRKVVEEIPANCSCTDKNGIEYNFCYINPNKSTMIGKRFNCKHLEAVKELGLFDTTNYIDLSNYEMPDPQFVAALSSNHIHEGRRQLKNLHSLWPTKKIVVFDMGLGQYRKEYENSSLIDLRTFPFSKYPSNVEKLFEYRWKPIIIADLKSEKGKYVDLRPNANFWEPNITNPRSGPRLHELAVGQSDPEMLKEFGSIFYIDASIVFKDADLSPVYNLLRCKNSNTRVLQNVSLPKYVNTEQINAMLKECNKSSYLFLIQTDHSIFAATHPDMYDYLPINLNISKNNLMDAATLATVVRTKEAIENIVKWSVLCALEENCMGPPGSKIPCDYKDPLKEYGHCHRYDQSAISILSKNLLNGDDTISNAGFEGYFIIDRF